jgi:uncharacterized membrane protein
MRTLAHLTRLLLAVVMAVAGVAHLVNTAEFHGQLPPWVPLRDVYQWLAGTDAFGLDTDRARLLRLPFQPVLVVWALWCTGAWAWLRDRRANPPPTKWQ